MENMRNRELNLSSSDSWERAISNLEGALRRREKLSKEKNTMGKIRKVKQTPICFEYIENYQETMSPQRFNKIQPFSTFDDKCNQSDDYALSQLIVTLAIGSTVLVCLAVMTSLATIAFMRITSENKGRNWERRNLDDDPFKSVDPDFIPFELFTKKVKEIYDEEIRGRPSLLSPKLDTSTSLDEDKVDEDIKYSRGMLKEPPVIESEA
ncbi:hypothetical protein ACOME3_003285 [Neoechinorhynchus agilis]